MMADNKPFITVVIPVYNKEKYISRAIDSVLSQTYQNFEIVIVCDPSTDNSNEEAEKFKDIRIRVFHRDEPGPGGYAARNLGIKEARGEWISFLDADDVWTHDHLLHVNHLQNLYPQCSLISTSRLIIEQGKSYRDRFSQNHNNDSELFTFKEYLKLSYLIDKPFHTNTVIFKKSILDGADLFPEGKTNRSGDIYSWVFLSHKAKTFLWSRHIGTHIHKDVVGVTKQSVPNIAIFQQMVAELCPNCTEEEGIWLKRYANKLIKTAWLENSKAKLSLKPLHQYLFWNNHFIYCIFWSLVAILPRGTIECTRAIRKKLKLLFVTPY